MQVMELIATDPGAPTLAQLAARMEVPKTSLVHMLRALEQAGYVSRTSQGFTLGGAAWRVAAAISARNDFSGAVRRVLQELAGATRETVLIGRLMDDGLAVVYLDRIASSQVVRFTPELGEPRPFHCTAAGKIMLASMPRSRLNGLLRSRRLERFTDFTITTQRALLKELDEVRSNGFARSMDEMVEGGGALAVPLRSADGLAPYVLVIAAPTHRIRQNEKKWISQMKASAASLPAIGNFMRDAPMDSSGVKSSPLGRGGVVQAL